MMLNDNKEEVRYEELRKQVAQLNNQRSERNMMTLNDTLADVRQQEHLEQVERERAAFTRQDDRNFETGLYLLEQPTPWVRRMRLRAAEEQQAEQQQAQQQVIKSEEGEEGVTSDPYYLLQERW